MSRVLCCFFCNPMVWSMVCGIWMYMYSQGNWRAQLRPTFSNDWWQYIHGICGPSFVLHTVSLTSWWWHGNDVKLLSGWWFGKCFICPYIGNNHPNWLIFHRGWNNQLSNSFRMIPFETTTSPRPHCPTPLPTTAWIGACYGRNGPTTERQRLGLPWGVSDQIVGYMVVSMAMGVFQYGWFFRENDWGDPYFGKPR